MIDQTFNQQESLLNILKTELPSEIETRMERVFQNTLNSLPRHRKWVTIPRFEFRWQFAVAACTLVAVALFLPMVLPTNNALADTYAALAEVRNVVVEYIPAAEITDATSIRYTWAKPDLLRMDSDDRETQWIYNGKIYILDYATNQMTVLKNAHDQGVQFWAKQIADFVIPARLIEKLQRCKYEYIETIERDGKKFQHYSTKPSPLTFNLLVDAETFLPAEEYYTSTQIKNEETTTRRLSSYRYQWNQDIDPSVFVPAVPETSNPQIIDMSKAAEPHLIVPGGSIGPVQIGMPVEKLKELWGEPNPSQDSFAISYWEHGVDIMAGKTVQQILCWYGRLHPGYKTFTGKTAEGIGIGSLEKDIIAAMGQPDKREVLRSQNAPLDAPAGVTLNYTSKGCIFTLMPNTVIEMGNEPRVVMIVIQKPE